MEIEMEVGVACGNRSTVGVACGNKMKVGVACGNRSTVGVACGNKMKVGVACGNRSTVGVAADHGGFELKNRLVKALESDGYDVKDFGAYIMNENDDYPDYVIPLAKAVANGEINRGLAVCGSGVGACVASNKVAGVRAALITDSFSAHQGVEDDNMNIMCLGGWVTGYALSLDLTKTFLGAVFKGDARFRRRLAKVEELEK